MCCLDKLLDFQPTAMPDLGISLDVVFYPDFDICVGTNQVCVVFYLPDIEMTIVKKLREGVAYNKGRNELYVWLTDDDLQSMKRSRVQVQVRIIDVFTDEMVCSTIQILNMEPIINKRRDKLITLDKKKAKTFKIDYDDSEYKKFMNLLKYGDCNQNDHDDAVDALRYATENWLKTKHDVIGKVTDIHLTTNGLNFHVAPCNNYRENMFPNVCELAEEKGFENLMKLIDWDARNPYLECLFHDTHHQPFYNGNHINREKEKPMKTKKDIDRIVITKNDLNEVLLRAYSGDEIVEKTIAKCSPDDIFDFNIGAKLAVDRLYDGYDMTPKPKRKPYNGKIFIRADRRVIAFSFDFWKSTAKYVRENKIWEVKDGKIVDMVGRALDTIYDDMTDEELSKLLTRSNSFYIGYYYNIADGYFVR